MTRNGTDLHRSDLCSSVRSVSSVVVRSLAGAKPERRVLRIRAIPQRRQEILMRSRCFAAVLTLALCATSAVAQEKPDSSKPWSVEAEHGPSRAVSFTTDEGTWLSL